MTISRGIRARRYEFNVRILLALSKLKYARVQAIALEMNLKSYQRTGVYCNLLHAAGRIYVADWVRNRPNNPYHKVYAVRLGKEEDAEYPAVFTRKEVNKNRKERLSFGRKLAGTFGRQDHTCYTTRGPNGKFVKTNNSGCSEMETSDGTMRET